MALWVHLNEFTPKVINDLQKLCNDPGLTINYGLQGEIEVEGMSIDISGDGRVSYLQNKSSVGCNLVAEIVRSPCFVGIRGEPGSFGLGGTNTVEDVGGEIVHNAYGTTTPASVVTIVYDVNDCGGRGHYVHDFAGMQIPSRSDVTLCHELEHTRHLCAGTMAWGDPEAQAVAKENEYRQEIGFPLRFGHSGGCNPKPKDGGCFIATAAYGSEIAPEVEMLRRFRDDVLRTTRSGSVFFDHLYERYYRFSPSIVQLMAEDDSVKDTVRVALVEPIVRYLQTFLQFPDNPVEEIEEPWRTFLLRLRDSFEGWAKQIDLPSDFRGLSLAAAAKEIEIVMQYALRRDETRQSYLSTLERLGQIPLNARGQQRREIVLSLRASGRSLEEVERIVGRI